MAAGTGETSVCSIFYLYFCVGAVFHRETATPQFLMTGSKAAASAVSPPHIIPVNGSALVSAGAPNASAISVSRGFLQGYKSTLRRSMPTPYG